MNLSMNDLLYAFSAALDSVEHELIGVTTSHGKRVAYLAAGMGRELGLADQALLDLAACAVLHDNALTEYLQSEYRIGNDPLKKGSDWALGPHCTMGERNLQALPFYDRVRGAVLYHHENADGSGAFGKTEQETPLFAQLIHLADQLDAQWDLSYFTAGKYEKLCQALQAGRNSLFSARCVDAFLRTFSAQKIAAMQGERIDVLLREELPAVRREYSGQDLVGCSTMFAQIIDYKSHFTRNHSIGIAQKARSMAEYYGFDEETAALLYFAGAVHDIGKLIVNKEILEKPDRLTAAEYQHIQNHAYHSYDILCRIDGLGEVTFWAALHHEKLDGSGYPFGKTGAELSQKERLLACLDIYQALIEDRPYKKGMSHPKTMEILRDMAKRGLLDRTIVEEIDQRFAPDAAEAKQ